MKPRISMGVVGGAKVGIREEIVRETNAQELSTEY